MQEHYLNMAFSAFDKKNWDLCVKHALNVIKINKSNMQAWTLCAMCYENLNERMNAISCLKQAIDYDKELNNGANLYTLSINLAEFMRRNDEALQAISILKKLIPNISNDEMRDYYLQNSQNIQLDSNLFFNLAKCYADLQDYEESIKFYKLAIQINPNDLGALFNLANSELAIGDKKNALKYYSLAYDGGYLDAGINLAQIYVSLDDLKKAGTIYNDLKDKYYYDSNFCFNYANYLRYDKNINEARNFYIQAFNIKQDPRYAINLSYLLLSANELELGFLFYEYRRHFLQAKKHYFLDSLGSDKNIILQSLNGTNVILCHEQGFGDSIMFARFIARFLKILESKNIKCNIFLDMCKELKDLFKCFKIDFVNTQDFEKNDVNYIVIPLPSLPFICDVDLEMLNISMLDFRKNLMEFLNKNIISLDFDFNATPEMNKEKIIKFLKAKLQSENDKNGILDSLKNELYIYKNKDDDFKKNNKSKDENIESKNEISNNNYLKIAINFASNSKFDKAKDKSLYPLDLLNALPKSTNVKYYSFQYEGLDEELLQEFDIIDCKNYIKTFYDSAKLLLECDLLITIDSALAHLAGSLGIPTILLLHKRYDWRWGKLGFKVGMNSWYDNMIFMAQDELGNWSDVLKELNFTLLDIIGKSNAIYI